MSSERRRERGGRESGREGEGERERERGRERERERESGEGDSALLIRANIDFSTR